MKLENILDRKAHTLETLAFEIWYARAMSKWAAVEYSIANLLTIVTDQSDQFAILKIFEDLEGFRAKLAMADTLINFKCLPEVIIGWNSMKRRLTDASKERNKLAHWLPAIIFGQQELGAFVLQQGLTGKKDPIDVVNLRELAQDFDMLSDHILKLSAIQRGDKPDAPPEMIEFNYETIMAKFVEETRGAIRHWELEQNSLNVT